MTTLDLQRHIIDLAFIGPSEAPFVSCYLPFNSGSRGRFAAGAALREGGPLAGEAWEAIESFLAVGVDSRAAGVAAFARRGSRPFFLAVPFMVAVPFSVSAGPLPALYPLVELRYRHAPFLLAEFQNTRVRLLGVELGRVTADSSVEGTMRRQVKMIQHYLSGMALPRLVLAGTGSRILAACDEFPAAVLSALVGTVSDGRHGTESMIAAAMVAIQRYREKVSGMVARGIAGGWQPSGDTAAGPAATLRALASGEAETVWLSAGSQSKAALICARCAAIELKTEHPGSCHRCGHRSWCETDSREPVVHAAVRGGCSIRMLWNEKALSAFGGVACTLRLRGLAAPFAAAGSEASAGNGEVRPSARPVVAAG